MSKRIITSKAHTRIHEYTSSFNTNDFCIILCQTFTICRRRTDLFAYYLSTLAGQQSLLINEILSGLGKGFEVFLSLCNNQSQVDKTFILKVIRYCSQRLDDYSFEFLVNSDPQPEVFNYQAPGWPSWLYGLKLRWHFFSAEIDIIPQKKIVWEVDYTETRVYLADFCFITTIGNDTRKYLIECRDRQFQNTPNQLIKDAKRSDHLKSIGYNIIVLSEMQINNWTDEDVGQFMMSFTPELNSK